MKIFKAKNANNIVQVQLGVQTIIVPNCPIIGNGIGASEGYLIVSEEKDEIVYIPVSTPDLEKVLTIVADVLGKISSGVLASNVGGPITSPTFTTDIAVAIAQLNQLKGMLI